MKLTWRFIITDYQSPWAQVLRTKYLSDKKFWDFKKRGSYSDTWTAMLSIRTDLKKSISWSLRNGRTTSIWSDNWVIDLWSDNWVIDLIGQPTLNSSFSGRLPTYVHQLIKDNSWSIALIGKVFDKYSAAKIVPIPLPENYMQVEDNQYGDGQRMGGSIPNPLI